MCGSYRTQEVLETFFDNGGRVFDTQQTSGASTEQFHAAVANELWIQNKLFLGLKGYAGRSGPLTDPAMATAQVESLLARFKVSRPDLVQVPPAADPKYSAAMKDAKKEGRIRYLGAAITSFGPYPVFEPIMRNEPIDFISVDYNVGGRDAEEKSLPLAQERKIAVLTFFPFGGANGLSCAGGSKRVARIVRGKGSIAECSAPEVNVDRIVLRGDCDLNFLGGRTIRDRTVLVRDCGNSPRELDVAGFELPEVGESRTVTRVSARVSSTPAPAIPGAFATASAKRAASLNDPTRKTAVAPPCKTTQSSTPSAARK